MTLRLTSSMRPVDACAGKRVFSRSATPRSVRLSVAIERVRRGGRVRTYALGPRRTARRTVRGESRSSSSHGSAPEPGGGRSAARTDSGPCALAESTIGCRSAVFLPGDGSETAALSGFVAREPAPPQLRASLRRGTLPVDDDPGRETQRQGAGLGRRRAAGLESVAGGRNHSQTGPAWGYDGSGPVQLALVIVLAVTDQAAVERYYQRFKWGWSCRSRRTAGRSMPARFLGWLELAAGTDDVVHMAVET